MSALLPIADSASTRRELGVLLRPHRWLAVAALVAMLTATGIGLLTAPLLGRIVDVVAGGGAPSSVSWLAAALAGVALGQAATLAVALTWTAKLGETLLAGLRERFLAAALSLPLERVEEAGSGDLTSRVTNDVTVIARAVREALPELGRSGLTIVLTLGGLAVLDWRFLVVALVAVPIQAHTARWYLRRAVPLYAAQRVAAGAQQQQLLESLGGARTVRAFGLQADHTARVRARSSAAVDLTLQGVRLVTRFYARLNLAEFLGLGAVLVTGYWLVGRGSVSLGTATAAALYFHGLFNPINAALALLDDAQSALASLSRLVGLAPRPEQQPSAARSPGPGQGLDQTILDHTILDQTIKVSGLRHWYAPGRWVLDGIDLEVSTGQRVALVGASGAGKSTLAKLIAGIHQPVEGSISIGGRTLGEWAGDARSLGPRGLGAHGSVAPGTRQVPVALGTRQVPVALVTQEVHVFSGTLADDLRLARPDADDAALREALATVGALDWAQALPHSLNTQVGEGAHRLTVTQAQQLALARLVLADPPVAILDEATADAGSAGARVLERAADAALRGRTALVVAHRLSQAAAADAVIVLDGGRVVEQGSHPELLSLGGRYAELWAAWSAARISPQRR